MPCVATLPSLPNLELFAHPLPCRFALRAKGKSVTTIVAQASLVTTSYVNSLALAELKWKWFAFYLGMLCMGLVIIFLFVPETKGLTLEEIANLFEPGVVDVSHADAVAHGDARIGDQLKHGSEEGSVDEDGKMKGAKGEVVSVL
jgi:hypothetical protein